MVQSLESLQGLLSLAQLIGQLNTQQQTTPLLPQLPQTRPQGNIFGMPASDFVNIMGTAAHAIAPNTWGGRLGAGMVNLQEQNRQNYLKNLDAQVGLGRYGMEQQKYLNELAQQNAMSRSRARIMSRLSEPAGYEDTQQGMSIPTLSALDRMSGMERAYLESEMLSSNPNLQPLLKTTAPPKISGYKTVDESGKPTYLTEYGEPTGIEAYISPKEVEPYRAGTVREFTVGNRTVYKTYKGNGQWEDMAGVGGGRYKETGGGAGGAKADDKYQKNVAAYKREVASMEQQYNAMLMTPEYSGNSRSAIFNRNMLNEKYAKDRDAIVKKYRGKIDFINDTTAPTTNMERKIGSEWSEGGRKFRINPQTGKKEMWVE